jgi:hypothetical protein
MYRYEYGRSGYVAEAGVHSDSNRTSLGNDWWFAWGQFTTQSTTTYLWLTGMWYYQYNVYDTIYIAGVSLHQGTNIIPAKFMLTPQENRGTTVATGGGWADLSGRGNNGELVNGVKESGDNLGSLVFDGTNDYIDCGNSSSLTITDNITVSIWVRRTSYNSNISTLIRRNSYDSYAFQLGPSSPTIWWKINTGPSTWAQTATTSLNLNEWANIVGTYDKSTMRLYKNGVQVQTLSETASINYSVSDNLIIGRDDPVSGRYFIGNIAQVSIYNRALTASEIQQNFNANRSRFGI